MAAAYLPAVAVGCRGSSPCRHPPYSPLISGANQTVRCVRACLRGDGTNLCGCLRPCVCAHARVPACCQCLATQPADKEDTAKTPSFLLFLSCCQRRTGVRGGASITISGASLPPCLDSCTCGGGLYHDCHAAVVKGEIAGGGRGKVGEGEWRLVSPPPTGRGTVLG